MRYLLKPVTMEKLGSLLDELLEAAEEDTVCITVGGEGCCQEACGEQHLLYRRCRGITRSFI